MCRKGPAWEIFKFIGAKKSEVEDLTTKIQLTKTNNYY